MENDILDSLNDMGYEGPLSEEAAFSKALEGGPKSLEYTKLVHILADELKNLCNLEESVSMINDPDDSSSFLLELSSFLKELGCPYKKLVTGHMSSRLQSNEDRLLLLDYLVSELMAARMVNVDRPKDKQAGMEIVVQESPTAKDMKEILIALKFNKPPPNITPEMLFSKLEAKLKESIQKEGEQLVGKPLYNKALSEKEWKQLETDFTDLFEEYRVRREMLITRLECTIQSFEWSDRLKAKKDTIQLTYRPKREQLKVKPDVKLSDFLAARTSLLLVEKTSSASVRKNTQSSVNKIIIGTVPDRGGRPNEQQPPPPEMPSFQQRGSQGGGPGRGGGGHGRGRGEDSRGGGGGCRAGTTMAPAIRAGPKQVRRHTTKTNATTRPTKYPPAATTRIVAATTLTVAVTTRIVATIRIGAATTRIGAAMSRIGAATADTTRAGIKEDTRIMIAWVATIRDIVKVVEAVAILAIRTTRTTKATRVAATRTSTTTATGAAAAATGGGVDTSGDYHGCRP